MKFSPRLSAPVMLTCITAFALVPGRSGAEGDPPQVHDRRLQLTHVAEDPEIVTPIGLAIDDRDRLFVLESHTHQAPADYNGPNADRVKMFTDADSDGHFEQQSVFADGIEQGMNLAFSPSGVLYVVCAREVLRLPDADDDGVCDGPAQVLRMQTK